MRNEVKSKIESLMPLIDENRFQEIYDHLSSSSVFGQSNKLGEFTLALIESGIDPLEYMQNIPECFCYFGSSNSHSAPFMLNIPSNIQSIGKSCFAACKCINKIVFSASSPVTTISYCAFSWMNMLTEVVLPPNVETIEESAFEGSSKLQKLSTLPVSLKFIGSEAFRDCHNLVSITYEGTRKQFKAIQKDLRWRFKSIKQVVCSDGVIKF